jgi:8-oxo-dGTP diphosphatase
MAESSDSAAPVIQRRGAVAILMREERLLVIRRSYLVVAPRAFCFPGGGIEGEESEAEALVREIQEELGVAILPRQCVWRSVTPWGVDLAWWRAEFVGQCEVCPNPAEVESVHWHTPAEMAALPGLLESNRLFLEALAAGKLKLE